MRTGMALGTFAAGVVVGGLSVALLGGPAPGPGSKPAQEPDEMPLSRAPEPVDAAPSASPQPPAATPIAPPAAGAVPPLAPDEDPVVTAREERIRRSHLEAAGRAREIAREQVHAEREAEKQRALEERRRVEDTAAGGLLGLVASLTEDWLAPWTLLEDGPALAAKFHRRGGGPVLDGRAPLPREPAADNAEIAFPAGRHAFSASALSRWKPFPSELLLRGEGMDVTAIVLDSDFYVSEDVAKLTLRDMTIHCGNNYFVHLRRNFTVRLERCRVVGFDMGAGSSCAFASHAGVVLLSGCRIEAGFGRSPGSGNLFDVRGALVVRVEDSVVRGPFQSVWYGWSGAAHVFERTRFEFMDPARKQDFESPPSSVRLKECTQEFAEPEAYQLASKGKPRQLSEINPAWVDPKER